MERRRRWSTHAHARRLRLWLWLRQQPRARSVRGIALSADEIGGYNQKGLIEQISGDLGALRSVGAVEVVAVAEAEGVLVYSAPPAVIPPWHVPIKAPK
jgi:hypothetical protein